MERRESTAVRYLIQQMLSRPYTLECTQHAVVSDICCTLLFVYQVLQCNAYCEADRFRKISTPSLHCGYYSDSDVCEFAAWKKFDICSPVGCICIFSIVSRKRAHVRSHYFVLIQGGRQIFVTSLHFTMKNRPCLHYDNLQHTNIPAQYCWQPWSSGLPVATHCLASYAYHEAINQSACNHVQQPTAKAHHHNSSSSGTELDMFLEKCWSLPSWVIP